MTILVTYQKDQGKVRERQEDSCFAFVDEQKAALILSDGMGGHAGGDLASQAAVAAAGEVLEPWPLPPPKNIDSHSDLGDPFERNDLKTSRLSISGEGMVVEEWVKDEWVNSEEPAKEPAKGPTAEIPQRSEVVAGLQDAFNHAQQSVCQVGAEISYGLGSAGCTLTAALITNGWLHVGHIGDSRAYLFRQGQLEQLTLDHSGAMLLVSAGIIKPEEARHHPESHSLYRFLGINAVELTVDVHHEKLQTDDIVLLCSDGLWGMLPDETIAELLQQTNSVEEAAHALLFHANNAGGEDNISVAMAKI